MPVDGQQALAGRQVPDLEPPEIGNWLGLLVAFDALYLGLSVVLFDFATDTSRVMTDQERQFWSRYQVA